jgi:hypothetical protein
MGQWSIASGTQNHRPVLFSNGSIQDLGLGGSNEPEALETAYNQRRRSIVGRHSAGNNAFHGFICKWQYDRLQTLAEQRRGARYHRNGLVVGDTILRTDLLMHSFSIIHN